MRAIDQIEDDPNLDNQTKKRLLQNISLTLQAGTDGFPLDAFSVGFKGYENSLQEVSLRIREWSILAPESIAPRIWDATAAMADRMAYWADRNWQIETEADLDRYTFGVAGAVGLLLSDLWNWYDGTQSNRTQAIGFGRGLQAVNILRNNGEDLTRGVNFYPAGWDNDNLQKYARRNLILADAYTDSLPNGPALQFCQIPLALAHGTLDALASGKEKLSRSDVVSLIENLMGVNAKAS
jgi:farnesyl-diphosphate farnesyltransferase